MSAEKRERDQVLRDMRHRAEVEATVRKERGLIGPGPWMEVQNNFDSVVAYTSKSGSSRRVFRAGEDDETPAVDSRRLIEKAGVLLSDYNTVEQVLLACAILVNLAGIMLESGRFDTDYYEQQRDTITILAILTIVFSIVYIVIVFLTEVTPTIAPKCSARVAHCVQRRRGKPEGVELGARRKSKWQTLEDEGSGEGDDFMTEREDSLAFNPMFETGAAAGEEGHKVDFKNEGLDVAALSPQQVRCTAAASRAARTPI